MPVDAGASFIYFWSGSRFDRRDGLHGWAGGLGMGWSTSSAAPDDWVQSLPIGQEWSKKRKQSVHREGERCCLSTPVDRLPFFLAIRCRPFSEKCHPLAGSEGGRWGAMNVLNLSRWTHNLLLFVDKYINRPVR